MSPSTDEVCPPYTAADAGARPEEQLHFTRDETITISRRLLAGVASLQALAVSLLITINVGGSQGPNGSVLAEDAYMITWSGWYFAESPSKTMYLLYTFYFYLNSLCVRHANGGTCLYHKIGHHFDDTLIDKALHDHFNETYQSDLPAGAFKFGTSDKMARTGITLAPFILLIIGMAIGLSSWVLVLVSVRAQNPVTKRRMRISSVVTQVLSGVVLMVAGMVLRADADNAYRVLEGVEKLKVRLQGTGWGFFAAVFCAAVAQCLAAIIHWTWSRMQRSLEKVDSGNVWLDRLPMNNERLPEYSRHDPTDQPPSINPSNDEGSVELQDMTRPRPHDTHGPETTIINRGV
ncbi:hypothetical protein PG995_002302 [Apiospora arundinis]|uniref:Uncharacterized protein n=1 Tax=Apiospora arundinis TaxID=335852 RepID=A0ABR2J5P1_9PEZI